MIEVSVIILTKNAGDRFASLLDAIHSQDFSEEFEVIVIDSGSTDMTLEVAKKFGTTVKEIRPEEFHHAGTRNLGAQLADGNYLVYLTQDAVPCDDGWLRNILMPLQSGEGNVVYGRQIAYNDAKPMDKFFYQCFYSDTKLLLSKENVVSPGAFYLGNPFISDVNVAMTREIWSKIRFDENIFFAEDKDFALRGIEQGSLVVYEPSAAVYHSHNYSLRSLFGRRFDDGFMFSMNNSSNGSNLKTGGSFVKKGLEYWVSELRFLIKNSYTKWIPYAVIYDLTFLAAFKLGEAKNLVRQKVSRRNAQCG